MMKGFTFDCICLKINLFGKREVGSSSFTGVKSVTPYGTTS